MFFQNNDLKIVDINLDRDMDTNDNKSVNSIEDELSHGSFIDSDMHEFNKMEKEIYGSQDFDIYDDDEEEIDEDDDTINNTDITEEKSESIQLIKPKIDKKPELGDPIYAYDRLQSRFSEKFDARVLTVQNNANVVNNGNNVAHRNSIVFSPAKSRISSRQSDETVLSQPDESDERQKTPISLQHHNFPIDSHSSSKENVSESTSLHEKLAQEQAMRFEHEKHIELLYESMNQLQSRHALAEETIDQLRLGSVIKPERVGLEQKAQSQHMLGSVVRRGNVRLRNNHPANAAMNKRRSMAIDSRSGINIDNDVTRRYSCVVGSMDNASLMNGSIKNDRQNETLRARSVDNDLNEDLYPVFQQNSLDPDPNSNQLERVSDRLLTRAQVIDEELQALTLNFEQHTSSIPNSPTFYQQQSTATRQKLAQSWQDRLHNIQSAYNNLNREFQDSTALLHQQQQAVTQGYADPSTLKPLTEAKDQIDSQLFSISMQLDNLEQKMNDSANSIKGNGEPTLAYRGSPTSNSTNVSPQPTLIRSRALEVEQRISDLEQQYDQLIGQYQNLKQQPISGEDYLSRYHSPNQNVQQEVDDLIEQLRLVVFEANGRSPHIVTPHRLEELLGSGSTSPLANDRHQTEHHENNALLPYELPYMKYQYHQNQEKATPMDKRTSPTYQQQQQQTFGVVSEEDRLSSATSSFKKGKWGVRRPSATSNHNKKIDDIDAHSSSGGSSGNSGIHRYTRRPPIKSQSQSPTANKNEPQFHQTSHYHQSYQPTSQVQSAISSVGTTTVGSMFQGATSGETLPVDENGVIQIKEPLKVSTPTSSKFGGYKHPRSLRSGNSFSSLPSDEDADRANDRYRRKAMSSTQKLDEEIRSLDHQLALAQLEEENATPATTITPHSSHHQGRRPGPYSGSVGSRNTRSLLGTVSPSNETGNSSRSAKSPQVTPVINGKTTAASGELRQPAKSPITSNFYDYSDEYVGDVEDAASSHQRIYSGKGAERRQIPRRNAHDSETVDYVDRWCQTPSSYYHDNGLSIHRGPYPTSSRWSMASGSPTEPPYYDHIDYWDGDSFHPERQQKRPGKSILRPPSQYGNFQVKGRHRGRVMKPLDDEDDRDSIDMYGSYPGPANKNRRSIYHDNPRIDDDPRSNWTRQSDPSAVRQYSQIGPHKYLVREYANQVQSSYSPQSHNRYNNNGYYNEDEYYEDEYVSDDANSYSNYKKYIDQRRLNHYIDDALQQAMYMRDHTERIQDQVYHNSAGLPNRYIDYRPFINGVRPNINPPPIPQHSNMPPVVPPHRPHSYAASSYINPNYDSMPNRRYQPRYN